MKTRNARTALRHETVVHKRSVVHSAQLHVRTHGNLGNNDPKARQMTRRRQQNARASICANLPSIERLARVSAAITGGPASSARNVAASIAIAPSVVAIATRFAPARKQQARVSAAEKTRGDLIRRCTRTSFDKHKAYTITHHSPQTLSYRAKQGTFQLSIVECEGVETPQRQETWLRRRGCAHHVHERADHTLAGANLGAHCICDEK